MTRAFLIRVGMDTEYGGFVSPIFNENYVFLPIPNVREGDSSSKGLERYSELKTNSNRPLTDFLPKDRLEVILPKDKLDVKKKSKKKSYYDVQNIPVHNDPEFVTMTYGEKKENVASKVRNFSSGDYVVFYAAFFPIPSFDFKYNNYNLSKLKEMQKGKKQYHIFGFLELKYPPIDRKNYKNYEDEIRNNVHYMRGDFKRNDDSFKLLLKGTNKSGWTRPIRIDDGKPIGANYQMKKEIAGFKLEHKHKRGLNKSYCELDAHRIMPIVLEKKAVAP